MAWGGSLGEHSRRDVEVLVTVGARAGLRAQRAGRWVPPTPITIDFGGRLRELPFEPASLERRTPAALTSAAIYALAQQAPQSRAVALVTGSRLTAERIEVIEVWVEHRDGEALTVLWPLRGRGRRLEPPRAFRGSRLVWAAESD